MGISIHIEISKSTAKSEWSRVYAETKELLKLFPLAERRNVSINDIDVMCLTRSAERETVYGRDNKKTKVGWSADGDYETLSAAEEYYMPRDLVDDAAFDPEPGDAIMGALSAYLSFRDDETRFYKLVDEGIRQITDERERYAVSSADDYLSYTKGGSIKPQIDKALAESYMLYTSLLDEDSYKWLKHKSMREKCEWLVQHNRYIMRDKDWEQIFNNIETDPDSFSRYYPMVCIKADSADVGKMVRAFVLNDDLYEHCAVLAAEVQ